MVYFVGAGPGAEDLITVRGARLLSEADVVVYAGSLINKELLELCRKDCEKYDSALMDLDEIIAVFEKAEKKGQMTVRLASGDPSIYGALLEMTNALSERGIGYEVCPGVSSFLAAAASLKKEYMVPDHSQALVITRVSGRTRVPEGQEVKDFARHGCSLAVFLSTGLLDEVAGQLIEGGYSPDSPVALVYRASWKEEEIVYCTVDTLAKKAEERGIKNTALVIAGPMLEGHPAFSKLYSSDFETGFRRV